MSFIATCQLWYATEPACRDARGREQVNEGASAIMLTVLLFLFLIKIVPVGVIQSATIFLVTIRTVHIGLQSFLGCGAGPEPGVFCVFGRFRVRLWIPSFPSLCVALGAVRKLFKPMLWAFLSINMIRPQPRCAISTTISAPFPIEIIFILARDIIVRPTALQLIPGFRSTYAKHCVCKHQLQFSREEVKHIP